MEAHHPTKISSLALQIVVISGGMLTTLIPLAITPSLSRMAVAFGSQESGAFGAQLVAVAPAATMAICSPFAGVLSARIGVRMCLITALLVFAAAGSAGLWLQGLPGLLVSRAILGIAGALVGALTLMLSGFFSDTTRERLIGWYSASAAVIAIGAMALGGWAVDSLGWRAPFAAYLLALPIAALAFLSTPRQFSQKEQGFDLAGLCRLLPFFLLMMIFMMGTVMFGIQGPFLFQSNGVSSAQTQGTYLALIPLASFVASSGYGQLSRRFDVHGRVIVVALALGAGLAGMSLFPARLPFVIGLVLTGVGAGFAGPVINGAILARTHLAAAATAIGINQSAIFVGQLLNPIVLQPVERVVGTSGTFWVAGAGIASIGAVVALRARVISSRSRTYSA
jgi:MFS family permease